MQIGCFLFHRVFLTLVVLFTFLSAEAKPFQTKFIKIELPPNWDCKKEELDYVCQPDNLAEKSEVILVIVAKAVNEVDDTLEKYQKVLSTGREMRNLLGTSYTAEVRYVREKKILDRVWVDSLQRGSEVPGFYSRYLASINEKIAGLITYSIAESVYPKWATVMDQMVESLVLTYDPKAFEEAMSSGPGSLLGLRPRTKDRFVPVLDSDASPVQADKPMDKGQIFGVLLVVGAVGYLIWKRKQRQG